MLPHPDGELASSLTHINHITACIKLMKCPFNQKTVGQQMDPMTSPILVQSPHHRQQKVLSRVVGHNSMLLVGSAEH
jgi:hypothetical protein